MNYGMVIATLTAILIITVYSEEVTRRHLGHRSGIAFITICVAMSPFSAVIYMLYVTKHIECDKSIPFKFKWNNTLFPLMFVPYVIWVL